LPCLIFEIRLLRRGYSKRFCLQFLVHFCFARQVASGDAQLRLPIVHTIPFFVGKICEKSKLQANCKISDYCFDFHSLTSQLCWCEKFFRLVHSSYSFPSGKTDFPCTLKKARQVAKKIGSCVPKVSMPLIDTQLILNQHLLTLDQHLINISVNS